MNPLMNNSQPKRFNPMQFMGDFRKNPVGALRQAGYTVPDGMSDPRQIVDYLVSNGQLNNTKLGQLQKMAQMFGFKR